MARAVPLLALMVLAAGCNQAPPQQVGGGIGVGVDAEGGPVVHFVSCAAPVTTVSVSHDRVGLADDEENPQVGDWSVDSTDGQVALVSTPAEGEFTGFVEGQGYLVEVLLGDTDQRINGIAFSLDDLAGLGEGEIFDGAGVTTHASLAECG